MEREFRPARAAERGPDGPSPLQDGRGVEERLIVVLVVDDRSAGVRGARRFSLYGFGFDSKKASAFLVIEFKHDGVPLDVSFRISPVSEFVVSYEFVNLVLEG